MNKLLVATKNPTKLKEYQDILGSFGLELVSLKDVGIAQDVAETEDTFQANAVLKAKKYFELSHLPTLAEDGGLMIDKLGGWPGVHSRRVWGPDEREATDEEALSEVLKRMQGIPFEQRTAKFFIVAALILPPGQVMTAEAQTPGHIALEPRGVVAPGFPYRRLFIPEGTDKTHGELEAAGNAAGYLNHRKKAILQLAPHLKALENN